MKRYILLAGETYYPAGWGDFAGDFDTIKEAKDFFSEMYKKNRHVDWGEIVDTETKLLAESTYMHDQIRWESPNKKG